jgi:organic radical activating enzyme
VTGGEPVLYNLSFLTEEAKRRGIKTFLETSGTGQITGSWDWICVSPKKYLKPIDSSIERANELKFIIADEEDFEFAESYVKKITNDVYLFLQPEWSRRHEILPKIVEYVKQRPYWRISLQIHKYMGIP